MKLGRKIVCIILILSVVFCGVQENVFAATSASSIDKSIAKELKKDYPFKKENAVTSSRRVFGISTKDLKSYVAYEKMSGKGANAVEYMYFVGEMKSKNTVNSNYNRLKSYIQDEGDGMSLYISDKGIKMFDEAKFGKQGNYIWGFVLKSSSVNKKAEKILKKKI